MQRWAVFSPCRSYRYALGRRWSAAPVVLIVGLNPSSADAHSDDPTVRRCMAFARSWGYGGLRLGNLFAFRATDPRSMLTATDPVGPANDRWLQQQAEGAALVVAAWGVKGRFASRDQAVRSLLPALHCLRLSRQGCPMHPLYLPAQLRPLPWPGR